MKTFIWDRHFETGLTTVDEQHLRLVDLINRLGSSFAAPTADRDTAPQVVFDELSRYAGEHFGDEERLMRAERLAPEYIDRHCTAHTEFVTQLGILWSLDNANADPREALLGFLIAWLSFHILGEDQSMAAQIAAIRGGVNPREAFRRVEDYHEQDHHTGALIEALQGLYHTLSVRNRELANANVSLELRVAERTRALSESNAALQDAQAVLEQMARIDGLLGIANRRQFDERLLLEWARAFREHSPIGLLMIDVDHFKKYNDTYGHQMGDECLKAVAAAISRGRRATDVVARYGGEEFALLLPGTPLEHAAVVARDAIAAVEAASIAHRSSPVAGHVTISVGAASWIPRDPAGTAELVAAADRALYSAKDTGRNRVASSPARHEAILS